MGIISIGICIALFAIAILVGGEFAAHAGRSELARLLAEFSQ